MTLLAKSRRDSAETTLQEHSEDVLNAFWSLFGTADDPTSLAEHWRQFFRMAANEWHAFYQCALPTMLLHDLGKANTGFQRAVRYEGQQVYRHEHLSALLLTYEKLHNWLNEITDGEAELVIAAIVGHHLHAGRSEIFSLMSAVTALRFEPEGLDLIAAVNQKLGRPDVMTTDRIGIETSWSRASGLAGEPLRNRQRDTAKLLIRVYRKLKPEVDITGRERRLLISIRAALIVADSVASGLTRERKPMLQWVESAFSADMRIDSKYVREKIVDKRIKEIECKSGTFHWQDFQVAAATLPSRSLMLAPCGSGKTLAAWRWIEQQIRNRSTGRIIFLYPTRATATEGFRDYVAWAPEASLVTGTAVWELANGLFDNVVDERKMRDYTTESRLFAIGYWHRRVFSATVDQFLGFMQNSYASICLLPMIVDSVVVIDEVHSFDRSLFAALKSFLKHFDVPVLCMTASLPQTRRDDLEEVGLTIFPEDFSKFQNLSDLAGMPRYRVKRLPNADAAVSVVREAIDRDQCKVLWVVNTVARCQILAQSLVGPNTLCYHSAFTLADRKRRHQEVVSRFQESDGPILAVTTQVCEMSLDLDANVLVTEWAPITSLIQRLGRCNRHAKPGDDKLGKVFVYKPCKEAPYNENDLSGTDEFLEEIDGETVCQNDLQELLAKHGPDGVEPDKYAAFLECGPYAVAREESLRDIDSFTVQAVLDRDIDEFLSLRDARQPTDGFLLPAPRNRASLDIRLGRFPLIVDSNFYSKEYGLERNREAP